MAFGAIMLMLFNQEQQKFVEEFLHQTAASTVSAVQHSISNDIGVLQALANDHAIHRGDFAHFDDAARRVLESRPAWLRIVLADRENQIVNTQWPFGSPLPPVMDPASSQTVYATHRASISGIMMPSGRLPEPAYIVRVPVSREGDVKYTLSAVVRAFSLYDILLNQGIPQGGRIGVIDRDQRFIARTTSPEPHDEGIGTQPSASVLDSLKSLSSRMLARATILGETFYFTHADIPTLGWTVLVAVPPEPIETPVRRSFYAASTGGAVALLLTLALAAWALRATARRLKAEGKLTVLQAEKELERRFADVADHFPGVIFRRVRYPDGRTAFPYMSRLKEVAQRGAGMAIDTEHLSQMLVPEDRDQWFAALAASEQAMTPLDFEGRYYGSCDSIHWFRASANVRRSEDGGTIWDGVMFDITDLKRAEQALTQSRDEAHHARKMAERADFAKSKFLAAASHDLRQPVQSLFFLVAALSNRIGEPTARKTLDHIKEGLNTMKGLLDRLLDVSKLDAGMIEPQVEAFLIDGLLEQISAECRPMAEAKGLRWRTLGCGMLVHSDPMLLARMIRNLVENAIRYTPTGTVSLGCRHEGDTLRIAVADTGVGIPGDKIEDIFAEFVQIGNAERDRRQGLGLGLAIVRRIARLLHHPVEVQSVVGAGSEFTIMVPLAATEPVLPKSPVFEPQLIGKAAGDLALVIDDDPLVLLALQTFLEEWGWRVIDAPCLQTALDRLEDEEGAPRVVVSDYRLAGDQTGIDVILALRDRLSIPFRSVLLTGETASECKDSAAKHGITVLHKPITPAALQTVLVEVQKTQPSHLVSARSQQEFTGTKSGSDVR
jgi:signal transduction histidine kinase/ActR/RegA family two-component response regulator